MIHPDLVKKQRMVVLVLTVLILLTSFFSLSTGYSSISYDRILPALFGEGTFKEEFVLFSVRLPRIIVTLLAGMALALSGAILQGITKNDLADPGIIGINAGAGTAIAVFYLYFQIDTGGFVYLLPLVAFIGACLTAGFIYFFSYQKHTGFQPVRLVLVGIGTAMALSGAMVMIISSAERQKVDFIAKWLSGNIWGADWPFIAAILPWLIVLIPFSLFKANRLNILGLSDSVSISVGLVLNKERVLLLMTAVALAAAAVSVTGGIAFIGLMAPHLARALVGPRHQLCIPVAILLGGFLLLVADSLGRNLVDPDGISAGIMTALIGAPYFIYLLMKK
ncbi:FecCD family ABC transporter permease [Shouchella shacheensis]|uniref:FecCD family ABC transporter permease n=1 Tax=Shouchella shacheensis TaxID=1649580 RepID=UPI00073FE67B|nr:iron ABC transporter permease [Shouchella shacheensis]